MAYYNHAKAKERQLAMETYEALKKSIGTSKSKYNKALDHMISMEYKMKQQGAALNEYHEFFKKLKTFLPNS